MTSITAFTLKLLGPGDAESMKSMLSMFGEAFDEVATYGHARPSNSYLAALLGKQHFIAVVALKNGIVVGGMAGYELQKFEQERSEIYIYDLAVLAVHRRQGIATAMLKELKRIAAVRGAYVIFVQADIGDDAAIALYEKFGTREEVLHFDIDVTGR